MKKMKNTNSQHPRFKQTRGEELKSKRGLHLFEHGSSADNHSQESPRVEKSVKGVNPTRMSETTNGVSVDNHMTTHPDNHSPSQQDVCCNREDVHIKKSSNEGAILSSDTNQQIINKVVKENIKGLIMVEKNRNIGIFSYYDVEEMLSKALSIKDTEELRFLDEVDDDFCNDKELIADEKIQDRIKQIQERK